MAETTFRPNWASAPGDTIRAIIQERSIAASTLVKSLALPQSDFDSLLAGQFQISADLAKKLAENVGSTVRFWLEREEQYHCALRELELAGPEVTKWFRSFPLKEMVMSGWLEQPTTKEVAASDLLEYFDVSSTREWREVYQSRIKQTHFRTSQAFENSTAATTAWIRRGELLAEQMACGVFDKEAFESSLQELKPLTREPSPNKFIPALQQACAKVGVAVVVARCVSGCSASGATSLLESGTALLLLSGRFLSDDQFWFSFFHEAAHLVLHTDRGCVEEKNIELTATENEANAFAERVILSPANERELIDLEPNKFSIVRFARRCRVSPGVIVGQLQHHTKLSHRSYGAMKIRYEERDFTL